MTPLRIEYLKRSSAPCEVCDRQAPTASVKVSYLCGAWESWVLCGLCGLALSRAAERNRVPEIAA